MLFMLHVQWKAVGVSTLILLGLSVLKVQTTFQCHSDYIDIFLLLLHSMKNLYVLSYILMVLAANQFPLLAINCLETRYQGCSYNYINSSSAWIKEAKKYSVARFYFSA